MQKSYFKQLVISFDQFINTLCGGWADETLSSRAYRMSEKSKAWSVTMKVIDVLFFWDTSGNMKHCEYSNFSERQRSHLPIDLR